MRRKLIGCKVVVAALFLRMSIFSAEAAPTEPQIGDTYEITLTSDSTQGGSNGSSGSSHDKATIIERLIGSRADGVELLYDLPSAATADQRRASWQFPARVFKPFGGTPQLLNGPEIEMRINSWLKTAGMSRTDCGHWTFTWNAFHIECDPQSVLKTLQTFALESVDVRDGAAYEDTAARSSGKLARKDSNPEGATFDVEMPLDADAIRRMRANSDVAIGEIMGKPVSFDAALQTRASEIISGTISVAFETDADGNVRRRTKVTKLAITGPDVPTETHTITETLERHRLHSRRDQPN